MMEQLEAGSEGNLGDAREEALRKDVSQNSKRLTGASITVNRQKVQ